MHGTTIVAVRHRGGVVLAGDVVEPDDGVIAIGSGGNFALAAAKALVAHSDLDAHAIAAEAMRIASTICVYTNDQVTFEEL